MTTATATSREAHQTTTRTCGCGCGQPVNAGREFAKGHHRRHKVNLINRMREGDRLAMQELTGRGWYDYRKVGVEIEVLIPTSLSPNRDTAAQRVANALIDAGILTTAEGYNHATRDHWKVVMDSSVAAAGYHGLELVSPPLKGRQTWNQIEAVCAVLEHVGARINRTCGLHVHVDAEDLTVQDIRNLIHTYGVHEDEMDSRVAPSRRGSRNSFCGSIAGSYYTDLLRAAYTKRDIANSSTTRYTKLNLQSLLRHGTLEFRQHQGTVTAEKIIRWVELVVRMTDLAKCGGTQGRSDLNTQLGLSADAVAYWNQRVEDLS